jgi:hypothetical protein
MLNDSKKPVRVPYKIPQPTHVASKLRPKPTSTTGHRLADARGRTSTYILSQSTSLSDEEKEALRTEIRQRFESGARSLPMTLQGLSSLANERIEDAIARGLFKNIRRGKGIHVQKDHYANSAFIDTTEYFMNKIIQKQKIVPPWIEKQQDLVREIDRFRQRLRSNRRRHASRLITRNLPPLRDPNYLLMERSYLELQIKTINDLTRSYNLQAPRPVQKPYLNLQRELDSCYVDVAPLLAEEIVRRGTGKASSSLSRSNKTASGMLDILATKQKVRVYDEDNSKGYGFKEFWRDLWGRGHEKSNRSGMT